MEHYIEAITLPRLGVALLFSVLAAIVGSLLISWQQKLLLNLGRRRSEWQRTGGDRANEFFDLDTLVTTPGGVGDVAGWFIDQIDHIRKELGDIDKLVFIERDSGPVGAVTLVSHLVEQTAIPAIIIRPRRRIQAASFSIPAPSNDFISEDTIVIISDVATSGRGIEIIINHLHEIGIPLRIPYALVWLDWNQGAAEKLHERYGIQLLSHERKQV